MKKLLLLCACALLAAPGCQKPSPVTVENDVIQNTMLELTTLSLPDTNLTISPLDSSGVLPMDGANHSGFLLLNNVTYDAGASGVRSEIYSTVYFVDRNRPLLWNGKPIGFFGIDVAPGALQYVTINSLAMGRIPYHLRLPGASLADSSFGYTFHRELSAVYQPNATFTWNVPALNTMSGFTPQIKSPDNLAVTAPAGGSVVSRTKDLTVRWTGKGNIDIVISLFSPLTRRTKPLLKLHPVLNTGVAVIDQRILELLPKERYFVCTVILAKRDVRQLPGLFNGTILIQAAAVHNSYIELQ
jgi:hypothetical protein